MKRRTTTGACFRASIAVTVSPLAPHCLIHNAFSETTKQRSPTANAENDKEGHGVSETKTQTRPFFFEQAGASAPDGMSSFIGDVPQPCAATAALLQGMSSHPCLYVRSFADTARRDDAWEELAQPVLAALTQCTNQFAFRRMKGLHQTLRLLAAVPPEVDLSFCAPLQPSNIIAGVLQRTFPRRTAGYILAGFGGEQGGCVRPLDPHRIATWSTVAGLVSEASSSGTTVVTPTTSTPAAHAGTGAAAPDPAAWLRVPTLEEQELALRVVQGFCVRVPSQRAHAASGPLLPAVVEFTAHAAEVLRVRRAAAVAAASASVVALPATGATDASLAAPGGVGSSSAVAAAVRLPSAQVRVLVALIEAAEAAMHYAPEAVGTWLQLKGPRSLLSLLRLPFAPFETRCAALHALAVLLCETRCLHRGEWATHAGSPDGWPDRATPSKLVTELTDAVANVLGEKQPSTPGDVQPTRAVLWLRSVEGVFRFGGQALPPGADAAAVVQRLRQQQEAGVRRALAVLDAAWTPAA